MINDTNNLAALIRYHRVLYYNNQPEISDRKFDALIDQIRIADPNHPVLSEVGAPPMDNSPWQKVEHEIVTGSQAKVTSMGDFLKWMHGAAEMVRKSGLPISSRFAVDPKLDGVDLSLRYEGGVLVHALTRGDGIIGEDIFRNAIKMRCVPNHIAEKNPITVRGQMMIDKGTFATIADNYKNARNACSGISRRLDGRQCDLITFIAFDCFGACFGTEEIITEMGRHAWLTASGFSAIERKCIVGVDELHCYIDQWSEKRSGYPWEMDGLVIRLDDVQLQNALGFKQQCPVGQIAWKFDSETGTTVVTDIVWQASRGSDSGRLTPKAILEPVDVLGVTITNATLNNEEFLTALGVSIGAIVSVARANDVIPQIVAVIEPGNGEISKPKVCPTCGSKLERSYKDLVCPCNTCRDKTIARVQRWITVADMIGVGEKIIDRLVESDMVKQPADLYMVTAEKVAKLDRMGMDSATKVVNSIASRKSMTLGRFVDALGIADVGESTLQPVIRSGFNTLAKLRAAKQDDLVKVKGIGPDTAERIAQGLSWYSSVIDALLEVGVSVVEPKEAGSLKGHSFCFTGAVQSTNPATGKRYTRKELQDIVVREGGDIKDSVGAGLSYLVQADASSTSSKSQKAKTLGTKIISDAQFLEMAGQA